MFKAFFGEYVGVAIPFIKSSPERSKQDYLLVVNSSEQYG